MTPERWGQMEDLYQAARALPPSERAALLERADPELRATVESILAQEGLFAQDDEKGYAPQEQGAFLGTVTGPEGWSRMKTQKKRSTAKTRFRPGRTGVCEAQLWKFTNSPGILKDDHAEEVRWVAAESLDAALLYMRRRNDDFMISRGRDAGCPAPPAQIRTSGIPAYGSYLG
jgi:hypothetical protein